MKKQRSINGFVYHMVLCSLMVLAVGVSSVHALEFGEVDASVRAYLLEKTKFSGSLDVYDGSIDKVRNLKMINLRRDSLQGDGSQYEIGGDFRDLNSGDVMDVLITVVDDAGDIEVEEITIKSVKYKKKEKDPALLNKKFTDKEVKDYLKDHIAKRSKFGGTYGVFDKDNEVYRQLNLTKLGDDVRNFGVLYINTVEFTDDKTSEKVSVDITLQNKEGALEVKTVRIKKIRKP